MNKLFTFLFDKWWRPVLFWVIAIALVIVAAAAGGTKFVNGSFIILCIALLGLFLSSLYQLFKARWIRAIISGILFGGTIAAFFLYGVFLFFVETVDGDKWADNLKIPANIQLANPIDLTPDYKRPDSMLAITKTATDMQLYNSFQPGLFEYDFWTGRIERGTIYLKAYEITQAWPLSTDRLQESSEVKVYNPTDGIQKFSTTTHFTIYEGDWGKPYAARFEVWFKPDGGGKERKLFQRNYKIEGWQR